MSFELRYPAGAGGTASWQPGVDFDVRRSGQAPETDTVAHRIDRVVYAYRFGSGSSYPWRYKRGFSDLPLAQVAALETFFVTIAGDPFDFSDGVCGPVTSWTKVSLVPESYARDYGHVIGSLFGVEFAIVEVI